MAGGAYPIGVAVVYVEPGVIKGCAQPTRVGVAERAGRGKTCSHVIRIVGSLIVDFMAAVTVCRQGRVIVVHVTIRARDRGVRADQGEGRVVVVEGRRTPPGRAVANVTLLREAHRDMVRVGRALKILQVTTYAGRAGQAVIPVRMTLAALQRGVEAGERPACRRVIERC